MVPRTRIVAAPVMSTRPSALKETSKSPPRDDTCRAKIENDNDNDPHLIILTNEERNYTNA